MLYSLASGRQQPRPGDPRGDSYNDTPTADFDLGLNPNAGFAPTPQTPPPSPNSYYQWRGFVPDAIPGDLFDQFAEGNWGGAVVVDRFGNYTLRSGPRPPGYVPEAYGMDPKAPRGIWQERRSFVPFKDLAAAQSFEYDKAKYDSGLAMERKYRHPTWTKQRQQQLEFGYGLPVTNPDEKPYGWLPGGFNEYRSGEKEGRFNPNLLPKPPSKLPIVDFEQQPINEREPYYPQLFQIQPPQPLPGFFGLVPMGPEQSVSPFSGRGNRSLPGRRPVA